MEKIKKPIWVVNYAGRDITRSIGPITQSIRYTDHAEGKSDDLELVLADPSGRWIGDWEPQKGDVINVSFGYAGESLVPTGDFEVDEVEASGPPDIVSIRALSTGVSSPLRTPCSAAFEGVTLKNLVEAVAAKNSYTVQGIADSFVIDRVTQNNESDLAFLERLAQLYGYAFVVRGRAFCFYPLSGLISAAPAYRITRDMVTSYNLKTTVTGTQGAANVSYYDGNAGELIQAESSGAAESVDSSTDMPRVTSAAQATAVADASLQKSLLKVRSGSLSFPGLPGLLSGVVIELYGWGKYDGNYLIGQSDHAMTRGGYATSIEVSQCLSV